MRIESHAGGFISERRPFVRAAAIAGYPARTGDAGSTGSDVQPSRDWTAAPRNPPAWTRRSRRCRSGLRAGAPDHFLEPPGDALLHLREARRDEEDFLVARGVVGCPRDLRDVERFQLRLRLEGSELAERRKQAGAVGLHVVTLARNAELERVPVDALELPEGRIVGVERGLAEETGEPNDLGTEEARRVAHELVDDVGLRRVERHRVVSDV